MKLRILAAALLCAGLSHAPALGQTTILPPGETCFSATAGLNGMIGLLGSIAGGSGYTAGTYGGVPVTGGSGSGATANVTVSGGAVTSIAILNPGTQYVVGDVLSVAAANIGGSGSGFSFAVASISVNSNLAAGTVGFYIPNTLQFKTTWKNSTQTIPNTNPVRLDQNGCALIYGIGSYRQIVKDSLGNTVWDALTASTAALSTTAATSGSGDFMAVGTVIPIAAFSAPTNYVLAYGQPISRTTFPDAFTALTISSSASCVSANTTISGLATTAQMRVGAPIEGSCLTPGTTIATIAGPTSVTVSIAAVSTVSTTVRVFPWGSGDGAATFNVPDLRGRVIVGPDAMGGVAASRITSSILGVSAGPPGAAGGLQSETISQAQLPSYTLPDTLGVTITDNRTWALTGAKGVVTHSAGDNSVANNVGFDTVTSAAVTVSGGTISGAKTGAVTSGGSGTALATLQPLLTINYAIKVLNGTLPTVGVLSLGGMTGDILCGTGLSCTGHTIDLSASFGTMALQDANNVAITGGTITGMPNPTVNSDVATKQYVDSAASGLITLAPTRLATTTILPNTPVYNNGALGVGATLTAGSNGALSLDGFAVAASDVVLIKNQASTFQNGIYTVTATGSAGAAYVLTRVTYFDQAAEMTIGSFTLVTAGATQAGGYALAASVTTVGTNAVTFNLRQASPQATPMLDIRNAPYNAVCDGVTDDRAAIQSALTAAEANSNGAILIPYGSCFVDVSVTPITIAGPVSILGLGHGVGGGIGSQGNASEIKASSTGTVFRVTTQQSIVFKGLRFNSAAQRAVGSYFIELSANPAQYQSQTIIEENVFFNCWRCVYMNQTAAPYFNRNYFENWVSNAVYCESVNGGVESNGGIMVANQFNGSQSSTPSSQGAGFRMNGCGYLQALYNGFGGGQYGIDFASAPGATANLILGYNYFENQQIASINIQYGIGVFQGVDISHNWFSAGAPSGGNGTGNIIQGHIVIGNLPVVGWLQKVRIVENTVYTFVNGGQIFNIGAVKNARISGNIIDNNNADTFGVTKGIILQNNSVSPVLEVDNQFEGLNPARWYEINSAIPKIVHHDPALTYADFAASIAGAADGSEVSLSTGFSGTPGSLCGGGFVNSGKAIKSAGGWRCY
jgi:microcystin-dependent protein